MMALRWNNSDPEIRSEKRGLEKEKKKNCSGSKHSRSYAKGKKRAATTRRILAPPLVLPCMRATRMARLKISCQAMSGRARPASSTSASILCSTQPLASA